MTKIPKDHPRYFSLITREKISQGVKKGLVHETGLIAHGRGEAFDYLIGEKTISIADEAEKAAAALLLLAKNPVISINGNVAVLTGEKCALLADSIPAKIEVNLFHKTQERVKKIINELKKNGAKKVYGSKGDAKIPGLEHARGICDKDGIFASDVVLVPLEDGDRCIALKKMGKKVITIDLNPISRTAINADITIVDNVIRAIPNIEKWVKKLKNKDKSQLEKIVNSFDNKKNLKEVYLFISKRLNSLSLL
jgi:4-phosphopantoate---beta-alanine ligase